MEAAIRPVVLVELVVVVGGRTQAMTLLPVRLTLEVVVEEAITRKASPARLVEAVRLLSDIPFPKMVNKTMTDQLHEHQFRIHPKRDSRSVGYKVVGGWRGRIAQQRGVTAWYNVKNDEICIPEFMADMVDDVMYAPTITHELTHAAQRQRMGLVGYLLAKTFRRGKLEAEAVTEEKRAQEIMKVSVL